MTSVTQPKATVGVAYSDQIPVPPLAAPLTWSVSAGALPAGIALNSTTGELTGTPFASGNFNFTVKVTDANSQSVSAAIMLPVSLPPSPSASNTSPPYRSASNTGPAAGTTLQPIGSGPGQVSSGPGWDYSGGSVRITGPGTILNGFSLQGFGLGVYANNVTIMNCIIAAGGRSIFPVGIETDANNNGAPITSFTIKNCTISGSDNDTNRAAACIKDIHGNATGLLIEACNLYWCGTGIQVNAGQLLNNYIHDLVCNITYGDHVNGIAVNGGTAPMLIQGNTIQNSWGQTDCIALFQDNSLPAIANKTISNNLLAGGGYCIYGGQSGAEYAGLPATHIAITNNLISTMYYPNGGAFGPVAYFTPGNQGNEWSNNVWHDGPHMGVAIPAP
jgi:Putative Ig domain